MIVRLRCRQCGWEIEIPHLRVPRYGARIRCPECGSLQTVPAQPAARTPQDAAAARLAGQSSPPPIVPDAKDATAAVMGAADVDAPTTTSPSTAAPGLSGAPVSGSSGAPVSGSSGAPVSGSSGAPVSGSSGAPVSGSSGAPVSGSSGAPVSGSSGAPTATSPGSSTSASSGPAGTTDATSPAKGEDLAAIRAEARHLLRMWLRELQRDHDESLTGRHVFREHADELAHLFSLWHASYPGEEATQLFRVELLACLDSGSSTPEPHGTARDPVAGPARDAGNGEVSSAR